MRVRSEIRYMGDEADEKNLTKRYLDRREITQVSPLSYRVCCQKRND